MKSILEVALSEYMTKEFAGSKTNPAVLKYYQEIGFKHINDDETPWCSAFINWCAKQAGLKGSGKLAARSFMEVGTAVTEPQLGDICVLWRDSKTGWKGHVGIFIKEDEGLLYLLGGNQGNAVCIAPYSESRLLGYRRLQSL